MSIFNEPEFQKMVRGVKLYRLWSLARCIYCWAFLLVPLMFLEEAVMVLPRLWLWLYLFSIIGLFIWGIALWVKGSTALVSPIHKPLKKFIKNPSELGLRKVCAALVANRKDRKYPSLDYDLLREAHSIALHSPDVVPSETLKFYTLILRNCKVAGV